ncbi:TIGR04104 family putative zinc finger protein [Lentibacillus persicus]|uniref:TIGR04104 family putative zinc finger protein n=1 Tax=Lentibacillus persicus TaxID=640948 RepID=UPI000B7C5A96
MGYLYLPKCANCDNTFELGQILKQIWLGICIICQSCGRKQSTPFYFRVLVLPLVTLLPLYFAIFLSPFTSMVTLLIMFVMMFSLSLIVPFFLKYDKDQAE